MELKTELDSLLLAARQTLERSGEASDRLEALREEILVEEAKLGENQGLASDISARLSELGLNAKLIEPEEAAELTDLESLEALMTERLATRRSTPPPNNVVFITSISRPEDHEEKTEITEEAKLEKKMAEVLREALATLTPREEKIIRVMYGIGTESGQRLEKHEVFDEEHVARELEFDGGDVWVEHLNALHKLRSHEQISRLATFREEICLLNLSSREETLLLKLFLRDAIWSALATLTVMEERIIREMYGIGTHGGPRLIRRQVFTQDTVARECEVSQATVSVKYRKALRSLRYPSITRRLRPYWEVIDPDNLSSREENLLLSIFSSSWKPTSTRRG